MFKTNVKETLEALPALLKIREATLKGEVPVKTTLKVDAIASSGNRIDSANDLKLKIIQNNSRLFDPKIDKDIASKDIALIENKPYIITNKERMEKQLDELNNIDITILDFVPYELEEIKDIKVPLSELKSMGKFLNHIFKEDKSEKIEIKFEDEKEGAK